VLGCFFTHDDVTGVFVQYLFFRTKIR